MGSLSLLSYFYCFRFPTCTGHEPFPERSRGSRRGATDGRDHHAPAGAVQNRLARHDDHASASRKHYLYRSGLSCSRGGEYHQLYANALALCLFLLVSRFLRCNVKTKPKRVSDSLPVVRSNYSEYLCVVFFPFSCVVQTCFVLPYSHAHAHAQPFPVWAIWGFRPRCTLPCMTCLRCSIEPSIIQVETVTETKPHFIDPSFAARGHHSQALSLTLAEVFVGLSVLYSINK